ncbi:MAG: IreB family regulatory phosphoprotein [Ruminococcus sp.]|nr:IreB family regulatory phosphoprotein [Candidatus Apopatosoma intestinale]
MDERKEATGTFVPVPETEKDNLQLLREVYEALNEKGYHPINQIVGYLLSEDPTYITNYKNARSLICKIDREELLCSMVEQYLGL